MNIGDKVRMLRGKEEGFITKIINDKLVEVEIEDGFRIPTLRSDLVIVSTEEANYFDKEEREEVPIASPPKGKIADAGFCLAFHPINDRDFSVFLINGSHSIVPFTVYYQRKEELVPKLAGHLAPSTHVKLDILSRTSFETWPEIIIQALRFSPKGKQVIAPLEKKFKFRAASFFKNEKIAPVIMKKSFIFEINTAETVTDVKKLNEKLLEGSSQSHISNILERPSSVVDLHIEKLVDNVEVIPKSAIINMQLQAFEKALDNAIASGLSEITFIHGVGNGVLRDNIHKRLSRHPNIAYYKDAMKEKFGYGATVVKIG